MKIGLIAMSGVRAYDEELTQLGLNLPGFVERSRVIASLPSLGLLTLASYIPAEVEVEYLEVEDIRTATPPMDRFDLVAISSFSAQMNEAYQLADQYRQHGARVVLGGLHASVLPDEAALHADAVVVGEGEWTWPVVVADAMEGNLQPIYRPPRDHWFDLADALMPRFDLLDFDKYNRLTVQTSRGCPLRCDFCASSILLTPKYRVKPVNKVIAEIHRIKDFWEHPFIEFADDNSFVLKDHYRELLGALKQENLRWFTECDISIADDLDLLHRMRESGCRQVLIGLESPSSAGLEGIETRRNWKRERQSEYEERIRIIQAHGITVNGCFILGLDGDGEEVFDEVYDFIDRTGLYEAQITVLTAFPGTPLYARLLAEGRLIDEKAWNLCTLFDVNFIPRQMTPDRLRKGLVDLARRVYDRDFVQSRRKRFFEDLRSGMRLDRNQMKEVERNAALD